MQPAKSTNLPFSKIRQLFFSLINGCTVGITVLFINISYAALIYSGNLEVFFPIGVKLILLGSFILMIITALFSSLPIAISSTQNHALPVFAVMTNTIFTSLTAQHHYQEIFSTIIFSIAISTIITGLFFMIMGYLKLAYMISFMPYPVIGGFIAGIGWLLFYRAFHLLIPGFDHSLISLFSLSNALHWIPSIVFAIILLTLTKKIEYPLLLPICLTSGIVLFFVFIFITNIPLHTLRDQGFIFNINTVGDHFESFKFSFQLISWNLIAAEISRIAIIPLLCIIAMLLHETALEVALKREINFNHELIVVGWGNFLAGLAVSIPGFKSMSATQLNQKMQKKENSKSRVPGLFAAGLYLLMLLFDVAPLNYFPKFVFGGLLMFLGLSFLQYWVFEVRKSLPLMDYLLILFILFVIAYFGILNGVLTGIVISLVFFIINYSGINVILCELKGHSLQSTKKRDPNTQKLLTNQCSNLFYFQLQNYLFFGNSNILFKHLRDLIANKSIHYLIYDFYHIVGLDLSSMMTFEKIKQLAIDNHMAVILTGMNRHISSFFKKNHYILEKDSFFHYFATVDEALEWCEEDIIFKSDHKPLSTITLEESLSEFTNKENKIKELKEFFETVAIKKGDYLFKQNDHSTDTYFIESGSITLQVETVNKKTERLRTIGPGNVIGEMSIYNTKTRGASAVAEEDSVLQKISKEKIHTMESKSPELAILFHKYIIGIMVKRVINANKQLG